MTKIVKATEEQRKAYKGTYPLYGWVTYDGVTAVIEDQEAGGEDPDNEIKYWMGAPDGYRFRGYQTHGKHANTLREVKQFAAYLEKGEPQ